MCKNACMAGISVETVSFNASSWTDFWNFKEYLTSLTCTVQILLWLLKIWRYFGGKSYEKKELE